MRTCGRGQHPGRMSRVVGGGGLIMGKKILLLYFMFQSILNILRASKKLIIFTDGGYPPSTFLENSAKIINLIFEPFPNRVKISVYLCMCCHVKLVMSPDIA